MSSDMLQLVCAIAGPVTTRTLENLRRSLEEMYVRSTAQGSSDQEQSAFSPELIAIAHAAAKADNAKTIVDWALAIQIQLYDAEFAFARLAQVAHYINAARQKVTSLQVDPETPPRIVRKAKEELAKLEDEMRVLREALSVSGHSPRDGSGEIPSRYTDLDSYLSHLPHTDP
jgi:hypothetical protein